MAKFITSSTIKATKKGEKDQRKRIKSCIHPRIEDDDDY